MQELLPNGWDLSCNRLLDKCIQWDLMNTPIKIHEQNKINHKYHIRSIRCHNYYLFHPSILLVLKSNDYLRAAFISLNQSFTDVEESKVAWNQH